MSIRAGDQAKILYSLPASEIALWPERRAELEAWARENQVQVFELRPELQREEGKPGAAPLAEQLHLPPEALLRDYAEQERMTPEMLELGLGFLRTARDGA